MDSGEREVLVVEDSEIQAIALKRLLTEMGFRVSIARDGKEGLEMARKGRPALIITDILMPVMDGYEMCRAIKGDEELKSIPVILLTQLIEAEEVITGLEAGAENYVTKPYSTDYLFGKVKELLEKPQNFRNDPEKRRTEFEYRGRQYSVSATRAQTINFLLSTYENAIWQNRELNRVQEELKALNERLEERVRERTAELSKEVADRRAAEEALKESEERFRALVETAGDAVVAIKPPDTIYVWNRKAEEMFGYSQNEAMEKNMHDLIVPERYREGAARGLERFFKEGTGKVVGGTFEMEAMRKDGTEFPVELSTSAMFIKGVWHSVGIIRDITERKGLEADLREKIEDLERMNRLMVGRELKMEDLRKEIRELRSAIEKKGIAT